PRQRGRVRRAQRRLPRAHRPRRPERGHVTVETLSAWLLSIMLTAAPPGKSRYPEEARETAEQGKARYAAIAKAIAEVSLDEQEKPLFSGADGRLETALIMLTVSYHESHWRRHVDLGIGPRSRGGGG